MRQRFISRLGPECEDVLDETLSLAQRSEGLGLNGLHAFLHMLEFDTTSIKREQEEAAQAVRVMTVHGSKGLEAPWVILPMGPQFKSASQKDLILLSENGPPYLALGASKHWPAALKAIDDEAALRLEQEALRLFYVAMTRARDHLTLCGYVGKRAEPKGVHMSWYELASAALTRLPSDQVRLIERPIGVDMGGELSGQDQMSIQIYGASSDPKQGDIDTFTPPFSEPPAFLKARDYPDKTDQASWRAVSQLGDEEAIDDELTPSPLERRSGLGRYRRGVLIHKLFELLPDLAFDKWAEHAKTYLGKQPDLTHEQREEIARSVLNVLHDARFSEAFGAGSRAEVAIAGKLERGPSLSGRIDRLLISDKRVLVIDYKSNRPAPDQASDAHISYQRQMAGYVALLRQIYPDRLIEAAFLWTDGPKLTPLSADLIEMRLGELIS